MLRTIKSSAALVSHTVKSLAGNRNENKLRPLYAGIQKYSSSGMEKEISDFESGYTQEEKRVILQTINTGGEEELKKFKISEIGLKKLIVHRDKIDGFKALHEVLLLQGLQISSLDKFCKSILREPKKPKRSGNIEVKKSVVEPPLSDAIRHEIQSSTGIWVCRDAISWARLDNECNLLQWDCRILDEKATKKGLVDVISSVVQLLSAVDSSDAYVMENSPVIPFNTGNSALYYTHMRKQQLFAIIATALGTRAHSQSDAVRSRNDLMKNIFMMRPRTSARMFGLIVGSEKVSASRVIEGMMKGSHIGRQEDSLEPNIHADFENDWRARNECEREQLNCALLLAIAFVKILIKRNTTTNARLMR